MKSKLATSAMVTLIAGSMAFASSAFAQATAEGNGRTVLIQHAPPTDTPRSTTPPDTAAVGMTANKQLANAVLFDKVEGTQRVAKVSKGQSVTAVTGEVHLVPAPMKVVVEHGRFHVGDQAYLLPRRRRSDESLAERSDLRRGCLVRRRLQMARLR